VVGRARTVAVIGLDTIPVTVEAQIGSGLPGFHVIGASGGRTQAAERVRAALTCAGVTVGNHKLLVSLAPADVPKAGARFDLAMAAAVLAELGVVPQEDLDRYALLGELALDGQIRPVAGIVPSAGQVAAEGRHLLVSDHNAAEARLVATAQVGAVRDLTELVAVLTGEQQSRPGDTAPTPLSPAPLDLRDVRGQHEARRALEIAAAGGHHLLLLGPPGCGKSMLAKRLPGLLPPLGDAEALEVAAIRSVAGEGTSHLDRLAPFRAPHHSVSAAALFGGGTGVARPGELSLAPRGTPFLDELFEWPRAVVEGLRQPLEDGVVRVARSRATVAYPARVQLACAANPCPCGGGERCLCTDQAIWQYRSKLSGPLADRLDLAPTVHPLTAQDLLVEGDGEPTATVAARVAAARGAAQARWGIATNAEASPRQVKATARPAALRHLAAAVEAGELTGRGYDRALRVARTCADLEGRETIDEHHVLEAHAHRLGLRPGGVLAAAP
jgi:magnesium chelatase family protein